MTTTEYLILITALSLFAAAMIYFKIAQRSRSKGTDFDSRDTISFESATISIPESVSGDSFEDDVNDSTEAAVEIRVNGADETSANDESEYLDDLEDAAAGLARLMHSSESDRANVIEEVPEIVQEIVTEDEPVEQPAPSVESVLGEEVIEQIGRIDSELDALEELVASIEESLEAFSALGTDDFSEVEEEDSIAEAA